MKQVELTDQEFFNRINNIFLVNYPELAMIQIKLLIFFEQHSDYLNYVGIQFNHISKVDDNYYVSLTHHSVDKIILFKEFPQLFPDKTIDTYNRMAKINNIINGDN